MLKNLKRELIYFFLGVAIICTVSSCGKRSGNSQENESPNQGAETTSVDHENQNPVKSKAKKEDKTLTLMNQYIEVPGNSGRYYHRLTVTAGNNEFVKNIIESSMRRLERQVADNYGSTYVNVMRNDDKLLSYNCGYVGNDYVETNYNKTIDVVDGSELELSDIVTNMDLLPRAMYAECSQVRDDYDDFVEYVHDMVEEDALYWSVNEDGILLYPDNAFTAEILAQGIYHPVIAYGFDVFLSYDKYPELLKEEYFDNSDKDITMKVLGDSKNSLNNDIFEKLDENGGNKEGYNYNSILFYAQDLNLIAYKDQSLSIGNMRIYNFTNGISCAEKIGDDVEPRVFGIPYLVHLNNKKYLLYSMALAQYDKSIGDYKNSSETFVFRIGDKRITLTDRVKDMINMGGGEMSANGFYMNSYEDMYVEGMEENEWNSLPMFKLTDKGKIVKK